MTPKKDYIADKVSARGEKEEIASNTLSTKTPKQKI